MSKGETRFQFNERTFDWCMSFVSEFSKLLSICQASENCSVKFNLMADAIEWNDEYPEAPYLHPPEFNNWFAAVLNARMSIILGSDKMGFCQTLIDAIYIAVPTWPGCRIERYSPDLAITYAILKDEETSTISKMIDGL